MPVVIKSIDGRVRREVQSADLRGADLRGADLRHANLRYTDLEGAYLDGAWLDGANLRGADLRHANLRYAYLEGAHLDGANLQDANLQDADLRYANLQDAKDADVVLARTKIVPDEGPVIGWKKAKGDAIVKLRIPGKAKRSNATGRKCRAEYAKILAVYDSAGNQTDAPVSSLYLNGFMYRVGETVRPTKRFDDNRWRECGSGIHFYITRAEAEAHV